MGAHQGMLRAAGPPAPTRTVRPWWAVPQWGSARVFGVRDEGWRQREPPGAGFRGRVDAEGDGTSPRPGIGVKPIGLGCGALRRPERG